MINLGKFNRHWANDFTYEYPKKRDLFETIIAFMPKRQIIALTGLRRTGKTTLLKQAINHLIQHNIPRKNILYFSFDEQQPSIDDLVTEFKAATALIFDKEQVFIFLDEVQKLENWQNQLKTYYDNYENIKFVISGSQSLFIEKKATESLAGRIYPLELQILSFKEYLHFRGKQQLAQDPQLFQQELQQELLAYARRNFIETINEDDATIKLYLETIVNKIVYEDIPALYPIESPEKLKTILKAIYSHPGMLVNYQNLANDLSLNPKTVEKYLDYLTKAKLVKKLYNYSTNFLTSEKKSKKAYATAPALCFLNENNAMSKTAENLIAISKNIQFFWRTPQNEEIDFIARNNEKPQPIESKYSSNTNAKDLRHLKKFMQKHDAKNALVITKDEDSVKDGIRSIPLWKYALGQQL